jgi:dihydrofolate reductase
MMSMTEQSEDSAKRPRVALIVAMGQNREIGCNNDLMWHLRTDMLFFRDTTMGYFVIMGRKNFDSIPPKYKPLHGRVNVIISRNPDFMYEECYTCSSLDEALEIAASNGEEKVFVIGGGQIYTMAMEAGYVDEMYITHVDAAFPHADVFFPDFNSNEWHRNSIMSAKADIQNEFNFEIFHYTKASDMKEE